MSTKISISQIIEYYHACYTYSNQFNEYGDREVEDVHFRAFGKVLLVDEDSALVIFRSSLSNYAPNIDHIDFDNINVAWVSLALLTPVNNLKGL